MPFPGSKSRRRRLPPGARSEYLLRVIKSNLLIRQAATLGLFLLVSLWLSVAGAAARERLLLDSDWKFHLGNSWGLAHDWAKARTGTGPAVRGFNTTFWRTVNLPHDWAVELPFDSNADGSHGFKALGAGFASNNVAWYRKEFVLPQADAGKRLWLEFDGVFRDCVVFVNGWYVGRHESGYSGFRFDITDVAQCGGTNAVAVKVDASEFEGWFYEGAGIYRHVWLVKTRPVAVAPDGTFVYARFKDNVPKGAAEVCVETELANALKSAGEVTVRYEILGPDGKRVASAKRAARMAGRDRIPIRETLRVAEPVLWSPETPKLHRLVTVVEREGFVADRTETEFGIRTVAFDATRGFLLNGRPYVVKGTCNHQDHAGVGAALPDRLQYFRIARLKEMGGNAYRCSHNPPTPELLEACDRLGMLVMDENRLLGSDAHNMDRLERLILRDRNHPSVVFWSLANEEHAVQYEPVSARVAATMQARVKELDPTRPVTYAANMPNEFGGINSVIEVRGWNYHLGTNKMDAYHAAQPTQPNIGTEQGSTVCTRGIYANDQERGYVSAYDDNFPSWAQTAETWWSFFAARPWLSGGFVWTGFDYRGEPTPYDWPCINSHFGILDTCGFPKDNFYYYQAWWSDQTVIHLLPHWNWPGREGQEIDVRCFSNCEEVELLLNGDSLGRQSMKPHSHLRWPVKYAAGTLRARGFRAGKLVAEAKRETTGAPAAVQLLPDRAAINGDGEDVSVVTVAVVDARGRMVPTASNLVDFALEGPGRILGVGNGDPSCHEPDVFLPEQRRTPVALGEVRFAKVASASETNQPALAAPFDDSAWPVVVVEARARNGALGEGENAIYRAQFVLPAEALAKSALELTIGQMDEDGWVYVNGRRVGECRDAQPFPSFDLKPFVREGPNTLAILVRNRWGRGGLGSGLKLDVVEIAPMATWRRSVFNGCAQIIVQAAKATGKITLQATAAGLSPATVSLESKLSATRPALP
jgi:beta-galactosidase